MIKRYYVILFFELLVNLLFYLFSIICAQVPASRTVCDPARDHTVTVFDSSTCSFPRNDWPKEADAKSAAGKGEPGEEKQGSSSENKTTADIKSKKKLHKQGSSSEKKTRVAKSDAGKGEPVEEATGSSSDKKTRANSKLKKKRPPTIALRSRSGTRHSKRTRKEKVVGDASF